MQFGGEGLGSVGAAHSVSGQRRRGRGGRGRGVSQRGQGDIAGRFAAGGAVLAVEFG